MDSSQDMFRFGCLLFLLIVPSTDSVRPGNSCGLIRLNAGQYPKVFTSPGYPGLFAGQTQCTWLIKAPGRRRVKLVVKDFLLYADSDCISQYVLITDDSTGFSYGPLCGRRQPEEIISAGNSLRIKLESDTISTRRYRGFKMGYMTTNRTTTRQLQDPGGLWKKQGSRTMRPTTTAPPQKPTDSIIDSNNNAEINNRNQMENTKNDDENEQNFLQNFVPVTETRPQALQPTQKPPKKTVPGRWAPKATVLTPPTIIRRNRPPSGHPGFRKIDEIKPKKSNEGLTAWKYVAIFLAVILVVLLVGGLVWYRKRKRKKKHETEEDFENTSKISTPKQSGTYNFSYCNDAKESEIVKLESPDVTRKREAKLPSDEKKTELPIFKRKKVEKKSDKRSSGSHIHEHDEEKKKDRSQNTHKPKRTSARRSHKKRNEDEQTKTKSNGSKQHRKRTNKRRHDKHKSSDENAARKSRSKSTKPKAGERKRHSKREHRKKSSRNRRTDRHDT